MDTLLVKTISDDSLLWGISSNTIFTVIITITIFFLGFIINRLFENNKESKRQKHIKAFFLLYIESFLKPMQNQIDEFEKTRNLIQDLNSAKIGFRQVTDLKIEKNIFSHSDLFKVFVEKYNKDQKLNMNHLLNILRAMSSIDVQLERVKVSFYKFLDDLRRYENKWNENLNLVFRKFDRFFSVDLNNNIALDDDTFLVGFKRILKKWQDKKDKDQLSVSKECIVDPLNEYCKNNIKDERALEIIPLLVNCDDAFLNITTARKIYTGVFNSEFKSLKENKILLEDALKNFK